MEGGIVLGSVAVSAVPTDVLPYISVAITASFLHLIGMCNICKNNIAKMFSDFFKIQNCSFDRGFVTGNIALTHQRSLCSLFWFNL